MPVKIEGRRIIRAPVQKVFQLVSRLDAVSRVTGLWLVADLVERKSNALTVQYRGYFAGIPVESVQRATLHPPSRIDFRQFRGNLKAFRGQYQLQPVEDDTEISLTLEAEVGIPLISGEAAQRVLHAFVEHSLQKIKLSAERELPRVVRRAANGAAAKEAEPAEAEEAPAPAPPREAPEALARPEGQAALGVPQRPAGARPGSPGLPGGRKKRRRRRRRGRGARGPGGPASPLHAPP